MVSSKLWPVGAGKVDPASYLRPALGCGASSAENDMFQLLELEIALVEAEGPSFVASECGIRYWTGDAKPRFRFMTISPPGYNGKIYDAMVIKRHIYKQFVAAFAATIRQAKSRTGCEITVGPDRYDEFTHYDDNGDEIEYDDRYWSRGSNIERIEIGYYGYPHEVKEATRTVRAFNVRQTSATSDSNTNNSRTIFWLGLRQLNPKTSRLLEALDF